MPTEHERRYVVTGQTPYVLGCPEQDINQSYVPTREDTTFRVRVIDDLTAVRTLKEGSGAARPEDEKPVTDMDFARFMFQHARWRVSKTRYKRDNWDVDFYRGPLRGLVVAEYESELPVPDLSVPAWIEGAVEVTDYVDNFFLAQLAWELEDMELNEPIASLLTRPVPRVVVTGGPCSGKSTISETLKAELKQLHFVPEVATIIFGQLGVRPPTHPRELRRFNRGIVEMQGNVEMLCEIYAKNEGRAGLITDRGRADNAAYLPNGIEELEKTLRIPRKKIYAPYAMVICLGQPSEEIYNANKMNNPTRLETYAEACELSLRTRAAWEGHHNFHFIPGNIPWEERVARVRALVKGCFAI